MEYFRVRNWRRFQHYKDRRPIWIKFYTDFIEPGDDGELLDLAKISHSQLGQLARVWALSSKMNNCIPLDSGFVTEETMSPEPVNLDDVVDFIEVYPNRRECAAAEAAARASGSASDVASAPSYSSSKSSSSEERKVSTKAYTWASQLLEKHGQPAEPDMDAARASQIIDELKNKPVHLKPVRIPEAPDPDLTDEERAASLEALKRVKEDVK